MRGEKETIRGIVSSRERAKPPLAVSEELDAGAVDQQVQWPIGTAIRDLDGQGFLPVAQRGVVWHRPVQPRQPQQARHHPGGLPERQLEQHFDRQTELDGRIGKDWRTPRPPITRRAPGHVRVHPDQQRSPLAQRCVVAGPVRRATAGGRWLAHAARLTAWIPKVNPPSSDLCNNVARSPQIAQATGAPRGASGFPETNAV